MPAFLSQVSGDLVELNRVHRGNMAGLIGIEIQAVGRDFLLARMPVDERTRQPFGLLHGGASAALAETLGSMASQLLVRSSGGRVAGIEIGASHLKTVRGGFVTGACRPLRIGRTLHVWSIDIRNEAGEPCCAARLTVAVDHCGD